MADSKVLFAGLTSNSKGSVPGQCLPIVGREAEMKQNNAGGFTFAVTDQQYLLRCLILGTTKNTYYQTNSELTADAIELCKKMADLPNSTLFIDTVHDVYTKGRAPKLDQVLMALAIGCKSTDLTTRRQSYELVSKLNTFSHLYTWKSMQKKYFGTKGFGKLAKGAVHKLISNLKPNDFAYQMSKYGQRNVGGESWGIDDIIRCVRIRGKDLGPEREYLINFCVKDAESATKYAKEHNLEDTYVFKYMTAVHTAKHLVDNDDNRAKLIELVNTYNLTREMMPTWALKSPDVWNALLFTTVTDATNATAPPGGLSLSESKGDSKEESKGEKKKYPVKMPITALIRNLAVMTVRGIFDNEKHCKLVCEHLNNKDVLKKGKVHPVQILVAQATYSKGKGDKGSLEWTPNAQITKALESAFYASFGTVIPTGKRIMHAIDVSPSMGSPISCLPQLTSSDAVALLSLVFSHVETEKQTYVAFAGGNDYNNYAIQAIDINAKMSFAEVRGKVQLNGWNSTDCSLPMRSAIEEYKKSDGKAGLYDAFIIYTDNDTYAGNVHPSIALTQYRELTGIPAKMIVLATTPTIFTIADPKDAGMMDIVGFDTNGPSIIHDFLSEAVHQA